MPPSSPPPANRPAASLTWCAVLAILTFVGCGAPEPTSGPASDDAVSDGTDIHLVYLATGDGSIKVTDRPGYDNQPAFSLDGELLLFTSDRDGQMDSYAYSVSSGGVQRLTETLVGEYSPTPLPDGSDYFSAIRMDTSSVQELWSYPMGRGVASRLARIDKVGYHTWVGTDRLLFFRLGQPNTLQLVTVGTADTTIVDMSVGRSLHHIPGQRASSYLKKHSPDHWEIVRYDWDSGEVVPLSVAIQGHEDYAWTPDGAILMAVDGELYSFTPGEDTDWKLLRDLGLSGTSRLAVSPDGQLLAVVAER